MVRPSILELMRKLVYLWSSAGSKDEKTSCGGTDATDHEQELRHCGRDLLILAVKSAAFASAAFASAAFARMHGWMPGAELRLHAASVLARNGERIH